MGGLWCRTRELDRSSLLLAAALVPLFLVAPSSAAFTSASLTIQVYSDGSALITQRIQVPSSDPSINVPLISEVLSHVVATDQNGSPLSFRISGQNITIYSLGATVVTLVYD